MAGTNHVLKVVLEQVSLQDAMLVEGVEGYEGSCFSGRSEEGT